MRGGVKGVAWLPWSTVSPGNRNVSPGRQPLTPIPAPILMLGKSLGAVTADRHPGPHSAPPDSCFRHNEDTPACLVFKMTD